MMNYRIPTLDLSSRIAIALDMLVPIPIREWGDVTHLAKQLQVSRTWLYQLKNRAKDA